MVLKNKVTCKLIVATLQGCITILYKTGEFGGLLIAYILPSIFYTLSCSLEFFYNYLPP